MSKSPVDALKDDPGKIVVIIGGVLALVSFLLMDWTTSNTGLDYGLDPFPGADFGFAPFLVFLGGLIAIILVVLFLMAVLNLEEKIQRITIAIFGIVVLVGVLLFYYDLTELGPIIGLVAGILIIVGAYFKTLTK